MNIFNSCKKFIIAFIKKVRKNFCFFLKINKARLKACKAKPTFSEKIKTLNLKSNNYGIVYLF